MIGALLGEKNAHLRRIEDALGVSLTSRGNEVLMSGDKAQALEQARHVLETLWHKLQKGEAVDAHTVDSALRFMKEHTDKNRPESAAGGVQPKHFSESEIAIITKKKRIAPRTPRQAAYIHAMQHHRLVFGLGPAGTGKTYLAVAQAVAMYEQNKIERIILTRPAIEAGEKLGFLPGEMKEKMDPYMRPLYDALHDTMPADKLQKMMVTEEVEIAPLAYMRGRTLNNAFIILDEGQNTTPMQMKMFLTRIGEDSHAVVTGDPSQTDLPGQEGSGLIDAVHILKNVEDISQCQFTAEDVIRSRLVARIVEAYDRHDK